MFFINFKKLHFFRRSPKAPKYISDLKEEIGELVKSLEGTETRFQPFVDEVKVNLAKVMGPMVGLLQQVVKAGDKEDVKEKIRMVVEGHQKPDNFVGKVMVELLAAGMEDKEVSEIK